MCELGVMVDLSRVKIKRDCPYETFYCPGRNTNYNYNYRSDSSPRDCIAYQYICDGNKNCDNGIDELNCQDVIFSTNTKIQALKSILKVNIVDSFNF